jgi:type VI secretion system protein ImpJ
LCTFALDSNPRALPSYDHDRLGECFADLDQHIRVHLEIIVPTNCIAIELERRTDYLYVGTVPDQRCFGPSQWILGLRSNLGRAEIISKVPSLVKICSSKHVERLFREALPGLTLQHLSTPPSAISPRVGTEYFTIGRAGSHPTEVCWQTISQTRDLGVYVPAALGETGLELLVIVEP